MGNNLSFILNKVYTTKLNDLVVSLIHINTILNFEVMQKKINDKNKAEIIFAGKLISLSDSTLTNTNGKNYKVGSIEFVNAQGEVVTRSCQVYEGNYSKGMELGKDYRATARKGDDGGVYIQLSHLPMSSNASEEDFPDELFEVTVVNVTNTSTVSVGSEVL